MLTTIVSGVSTHQLLSNNLGIMENKVRGTISESSLKAGGFAKLVHQRLGHGLPVVSSLAAGLTIAGGARAKTGGLYSYIEELYGPAAGFLTGWMHSHQQSLPQSGYASNFLSCCIGFQLSSLFLSRIEYIGKPCGC